MGTLLSSPCQLRLGVVLRYPYLRSYTASQSNGSRVENFVKLSPVDMPWCSRISVVEFHYEVL